MPNRTDISSSLETARPDGFGEALKIAATRYGDGLALLVRDQSLTWARLAERVAERVSALSASEATAGAGLTQPAETPVDAIVDALALVLTDAIADFSTDTAAPPSCAAPPLAGGGFAFPVRDNDGTMRLALFDETAPLCTGRTFAARYGLGPDDRMLVIGTPARPGFWQMVGAGVVSGATLVLSTATTAAQALADSVASEASLVRILDPDLLLHLAAEPGFSATTCPHLRYLVAAGSSQALAHCRDRMEGVRFINGFSAAETMGLVISSDPRDPDATITTTCGRPLAGLEVMIVDPTTGFDRLLYEIGEVWLRGAGLFRFYLGDAQATRLVREPDGFLRTGRLGYLDREGRLVLAGSEAAFGLAAE